MSTTATKKRPPHKTRGRRLISDATARGMLDDVARSRGHVLSYQIVMRPEPEGGYTVLVPSLPGCITYARTIEKAREMAEDAIRGYILSLNKHDDAIPPSDTGSMISTIEVPAY